MSDLTLGLAEAKPGPAGFNRPDLLADGNARCRWGASTLDYAVYHDTEWGRPTADDRTLLERLCLEGFQSGLSWLTILRKREGFRAAFAGFDAVQMARFGPDDVARLLADPGIVRHRGKIEAAINNARALVAMWEQGESLAGLVWAHEPERRAALSYGDVPAQTPASLALSKALKRRGFRFVGPTTAYAAMQAMGIVNDHLSGCWVRDACEEERRRLALPPGPSAE
ncbi:MAG: DNA-3-methyladenine glycosylase I [Acidimicrobiales bacterium]